jgi:hypothetical protein
VSASAPARPRIAVVHATRLAMVPIATALARGWPEAEPFDILDEALQAERARHAAGSPVLVARFVGLSERARAAGAAAILYTCSAFGPEIEAARRAVPLPTLKPNEAMVDEAVAAGPRIALLATFEPSLAPMRAELLEAAAARGRAIEVETRFVPGAMAALERGDADAHDAAIGAAASGLRADVLLLAQFSMARARESVAAAWPGPVLTSPDSAVRALRAAVAAER